MNNSEISIRMTMREKSASELREFVSDESKPEFDRKIAQEYLTKKERQAENPVQVPTRKAPAKVVNELTPEEEARLDAAEAKFEERQANRKTPSKADKDMKKQGRSIGTKTMREGKRVTLDESTEVPGLKVGSTVTIGEEQGTISRVYRSSDGKEKCMVKMADGKTLKKRVNAVTLNS